MNIKAILHILNKQQIIFETEIRNALKNWYFSQIILKQILFPPVIKPLIVLIGSLLK